MATARLPDNESRSKQLTVMICKHHAVVSDCIIQKKTRLIMWGVYNLALAIYRVEIGETWCEKTLPRNEPEELIEFKRLRRNDRFRDWVCSYDCGTSCSSSWGMAKSFCPAVPPANSILSSLKPTLTPRGVHPASATSASRPARFPIPCRTASDRRHRKADRVFQSVNGFGLLARRVLRALQ